MGVVLVDGLLRDRTEPSYLFHARAEIPVGQKQNAFGRPMMCRRSLESLSRSPAGHRPGRAFGAGARAARSSRYSRKG